MTDLAGRSSRPALERLAGELRRLRKQLDLSQRAAASQAGYVREYVTLAESGRQVPSREFMARYAYVLGAGQHLGPLYEAARTERDALKQAQLVQRRRQALGLVSGDKEPSAPKRTPFAAGARLAPVPAAGAASPLVQTVSGDEADVTEERANVERRALLRALGLVGVATLTSPDTKPIREHLSSALAGTTAVDGAVVRDLEMATMSFERMRRRIPSNMLIGPVDAHLVMLRQFLARSLLPTQRDRLVANLSQVTSLRSWLAFFDQGDRSAGGTWLAESIEAAEESEDAEIRVLALIRGAEQSTYNGRAAASIQILEHAGPLAQRKATKNALSWVLAAEAEAYATLGQETPCLRLLDRAADTQQQARLEDEPSWSEYWDRSRVASYIGACHMRLERPEDARPALTEALTQAEAAAVKYHSIYLVDLAATYAQEGEVSECCRLAHEALDIAGPMHYGTTLERMASVRRRLERWPDSPHVRRLDEHLKTVSVG